MTKTDYTLNLLRQGWHTALSCALAGGCLSLSQRVGDYRRKGWDIRDKWRTTPSGSRIKAYRCLGRVAR
jgi:hypothetical protein